MLAVKKAPVLSPVPVQVSAHTVLILVPQDHQYPVDTCVHVSGGELGAWVLQYHLKRNQSLNHALRWIHWLMSTLAVETCMMLGSYW